MKVWPIGVFTSIDAGLGVNWDVVVDLKIPTIQLHSPELEQRTPEVAELMKKRCEESGVEVTCVFCGFPGESYASIEKTAQTVGLVPEQTRTERLEDAYKTADFAYLLGCDAVGMHIGFIPEDRFCASYQNLVKITQDLLDHLENQEQSLHLETGQETADHLLAFIDDVARSNLKINFDPANMILYGTGDPIEALKKLAPHVRSVHCKDGTWAEESVRGTEWGCEVALGQGDVGIEQYLTTLKEIGYNGPLTIEREIPEDPVQQKADVSAAMEVLNGLKKQLKMV